MGDDEAEVVREDVRNFRMFGNCARVRKVGGRSRLGLGMEGIMEQMGWRDPSAVSEIAYTPMACCVASLESRSTPAPQSLSPMAKEFTSPGAGGVLGTGRCLTAQQLSSCGRFAPKRSLW